MKTKRLFFISVWTVFALGSSVLVILFSSQLPFMLNLASLNTNQLLDLSKEVVIKNFNILVDYLSNPFTSILSLPNIPISESGAFHFMEVKNIFIVVELLVILLLPIVIYLFRMQKNIDDYVFYIKLSKWLYIIPIIMIIVIAINFDFWFILFHQIIFNNQDWLFNPMTDPIILVLNENLFLLYFILWISLYEICMIVFHFVMKYKLKQII